MHLFATFMMQKEFRDYYQVVNNVLWCIREIMMLVSSKNLLKHEVDTNNLLTFNRKLCHLSGIRVIPGLCWTFYWDQRAGGEISLITFNCIGTCKLITLFSTSNPISQKMIQIFMEPLKITFEIPILLWLKNTILQRRRLVLPLISSVL